MHCPFTSENSVKRKRNFNHRDALFLLFNVRDNVRRNPPPPPPPPRPFLSFTHLTAFTQARSALKKEKLPEWFDYNGVAFSIELLEVGRTFSEFCGKTVDDDDDTFIKVSKL